jgi:hypothetical protein
MARIADELKPVPHFKKPDDKPLVFDACSYAAHKKR